MMKSFFKTLLFLIILSTISFSQNNISDADKAWGIMESWSLAKYNFAYFDQVPDLNWDKAGQEALQQALQTKTDDEYYLVLRELMAKLNDAHTIFIPPALIDGSADIPPVEIAVIEEKFIVTKTGSALEITDLIKPGMELISVDGIPIRKYFEDNVLRYFGGGTKQLSESFGMFFLLWGKTDTQVNVRFQDQDGEIISTSLIRNSTNPDGSKFQLSFFDHDPLVEHKSMGDGIEYIKLATFSNPQVVDEFKKVMDKLDLEKIKGMIIDIRTNTGGDSNNAYDVVSMLTDKPLQASKWKSRKYIPAFASWGREEGWYDGDMGMVEPYEGKQYLGPLVVLTGSVTLSSAEDFLVPLVYGKRATLIGQTTGGSTGNPIVQRMKTGGILKVCTKRDFFADGKEFVGYGIEPDIKVNPLIKDVIDEYDRTLEKAVDYLTR